MNTYKEKSRKKMESNAVYSVLDFFVAILQRKKRKLSIQANKIRMAKIYNSFKMEKLWGSMI